MSWTNAAVTEAGLALQAKLVDGQTLGFLRVAAGTGTVDPSVLANQTALANEKQTLTFQPPNVLDGAKIKVPVMLNNIGLEAGYAMQQLGFFVEDPDDGEILYAIVQDEVGDTVPSQTESPGFVIEWAFVFQFGNASEVTVTLDPVGLVSIGMVGQPNGVAGLDENGTVPIEQGGTGATTAQDAVVALGALFAIAAAAAYDPEGSYAVGDYCTHGGKLHKCGTPIESGEAWNAAHWTETTVAAELAAVKTELSNKLGLIFGTYADLSAMPERPHIYLTPASGVVGLPDKWPQSRHDFVRLWCGNLDYTLDFIASYANKKLAYRLATGDWKEISTATPPQEYNLPLADGITAADAATYCKTQEGIVIVHLSLSGDIGNWTTLGTLPEGVRPARTVNLLGFLDAGSTSTRYPIVLLIDSDGTIRTSYLAEGKSGTKVYGTFVFLAAS